MAGIFPIKFKGVTLPKVDAPYVSTTIGPESIHPSAFGGGGKPSGVALQNFPFTECNIGTIASPGTGVQFLTSIHLPSNWLVNNISWLSGTTALVAGTSPHYWVALYDQYKNLLGQSADNVTKAVAASSIVTDTLAVPYTTTYRGVYYVGIMDAQASGTLPTLSGKVGLIGALTTVTAGGFAWNGTADSALAATAPATAGAITPVVNIPWVGIA